MTPNTERYRSGPTRNNQTLAETGGGRMNLGAFESSARAFRAAISRHELPEPAARVLDQVLRYGLERGEFKAVIPLQDCFGLLCGLDKHQVSKAVRWLKCAFILSVEDWDRGRGRSWKLYSLLPPEGWKVPLRSEESARLSDLEGWLFKLKQDQLEFLPPPPSLNDLLSELFVECSAQPNGRVASGPAPSQNPSSPNSPVGRGFESSRVIEARPSISGNSSKVEFEDPSRGDGESCPEDNYGEEVVFETTSPPVPVVSETTISTNPPVSTYTRPRASIDRSIRLIESKSTDLSIDRSKEAEKVVSKTTGPGSSEFRRYVEDRLFRLIGDHERNGPMGQTWRRAVERIPERTNCLISTVEAMRREHRLKTSPVRWLNVSIRKELV